MKIAKLDPQPSVIWGSGYNEGKFGIWEGIEEPCDVFGISDAKGKFIACPIHVEFMDWATRKIDFKLIDGEWWWVDERTINCKDE